MRNKICLFITLILLSMSSTCSKENDTKLFKTPYLGSQLKLMGYFVDNLDENTEGALKSVYFFYRDGVVLYGRSHSVLISESELENQFISSDFDKATKKSKTGWGVFQINGNEIAFETWEPSNGGGLKTVIRSGEILNDSTFLITSFLNNYSGNTSTKNDTFHFRQFSPKPDSTNIFIN